MGIHDLVFQQITILGLRTFGERNSWLTGVVAELYFILNKFHLLASLNLLEKMRLPHEDHSSDGGANALDWLNSASQYVVCCRAKASASSGNTERMA